jgi:signal peptide peptidase SppA
MHTEWSELFGTTELFVEGAAFRQWLATLASKRLGLQSPEAVQAAMQAYDEREQRPRMVGDVAVIDVTGCLTYRTGWYGAYFGLSGVADLQQKFRLALADPAVKTIVFRFDSPGGEVTMIPEFAAEIYAARGQKPIVAVADTLVASAAYWLASQCETIYTPVSGRLGSIGVYTEHMDVSAYLQQAGVKVTLISYGTHKTDGNPYEPLPDEVKARIQARVDELGADFDTDVARGRKVSRKDVADSFGQGDVFRGKQAIALGMADKLGTFAQVLARLTKNRAPMGMIAGADPAELQAQADDEDTPEPKPAYQPCEVCRASACGCTEPECDEDCATCDPACGCRTSDAKKAQVDQAAIDAEAIASVLAAD